MNFTCKSGLALEKTKGSHELSICNSNIRDAAHTSLLLSLR